MIIAVRMRPVLYFHGFASSPASAKIGELRPLLSPHDIELITPDLNVPSFEKLDWDAVVAHASSVAKEVKPVAVVGSSMGALVALAIDVDVPMVLIAPAFGIARRWKERMPDTDPIMVFNHARGENAPIHRAFFEQVAVLRDPDPPSNRVTVIMGTHDETVPFRFVQQVWDAWKLGPPSRFLVIENGDHGLVPQTPMIAGLIVEAAAP